MNALPLPLVCDITGMKPWYLRRLCQKKKVPCSKYSAVWFIPLSWVEAYIRQAGGDPATILAKFDQAVTP
jgi:hypothetical protein